MTNNLDKSGLKSIVPTYNLLFIDIWGVVHDGISLFDIGSGFALGLKYYLEKWLSFDCKLYKDEKLSVDGKYAAKQFFSS